MRWIADPGWIWLGGLLAVCCSIAVATYSSPAAAVLFFVAVGVLVVAWLWASTQEKREKNRSWFGED